MKFGLLKLEEAHGAILAHALKLHSTSFRKGRVLSREDVDVIRAAGLSEIIGAKLSPDDIPEDFAAQNIAAAACGENVNAQEAFTGRSNVYAGAAGVLVLDAQRLREVNHLHESLTIATLSNYARAEMRAMVATIKVIPFAVPRSVYEAALQIIGQSPLIKIAPSKNLRVGLIITRLAQTKESLIAKSELAMRERVVGMAGTLSHVVVCDHTETAVAAEIEKLDCDVILLFGASAIVDRGDVIPAALARAGGYVQHVGMPVDPGNLLMLGRFRDHPVIGVPSCARSLKVNGFDWVLARVMAGLDVSPADIMDMGIGGLLAEIATRPAPRETKTESAKEPRIAAVILAAGKSSRMGSNKLLAALSGEPMVLQTVKKIAASAVVNVTVVTGHQADEICTALQGQDVTIVQNPAFEQGLASSLRAGVKALQNSCDAILVCLADMPLIEPRDINRLIAAFDPAENRSIVVPVFERAYGNPVLWGAEHFTALMACEGDRGARGLLENLHENVVEVAVDNQSVVLDADTPEALEVIRSLMNTKPSLRRGETGGAVP